MSKRYNLSTAHMVKNRKIFFDANILIYLFWPTGSSSFENKYSIIFSKIDLDCNDFVVDFIVLSEVVNRAIRIEHKKYLLDNGLALDSNSFKNYRDSLIGKEVLSEIYEIVQYILSEFDVIEKSFSKEDLLSMCQIDKLDFSDKAIVEICKENNFLLLTNDKDFKGCDIDILSCNQNLR